ncbi:tRNA (cytidine(34)-2'-O)-methyltransferase [Bartonella tamiae]|uniref:tRNA (cytidine(34)-2'-O)-methyltransferase n=1 Tax=Bartonella tamiae Th239 TaxID=1094558 RepID=J1JW33_9HYPH|nr:tRNA (cytidine(34)-2'-O)-methyltransferase [Bartonella tamiae]EJF89207.1 RNA methyltransferase, TrmH family, group 2 [Bartonella tamiae Th239]EJF95390.1 RNA methyltransferase, TrmH family, group 2 [Bartonella tamiae Th307]
MSIHIALYQPDIAGNAGTILRLGACLGVSVHIIEPAGFNLSDRNLKRAGMDYLELATLQRHLDWQHFVDSMKALNRRIILLTTKASQSYTDFSYQKGDILLFGRESAGVPQTIHNCVDAEVTIPMQSEARSINIALSVAMSTGEALRQLKLPSNIGQMSS